MDRVGMGRALGFGARQAARTLAKVAEAATAPSPPPSPGAKVPTAASRPPAATVTPQRAAANAKGLGRAVWNPMARFTGVLWLEVTGSFHALFAVMLGVAAIRQANAAYHHAPTTNLRHLAVYAMLALLFSYFSLTNFLRARRRQRR